MAYQPKSYRKFIAGSVSAAVVASAVAVPVSAAAAGFPDVPKGHWAHAEITALVNKGVITGYPDGSFKPSTLLNRGQAATLFTRALELEIPENLNVFKDLKATSNFAQYAAAVEKAGIFGGYANGNFGAGDLLTREQMATALVKAFGLKDNGEAVDLKDLDKVNVSHRENVKILAQHGITTGDQNGNFNPKGHVSRAHFATFLHRALVNAGKLAENPAVESVKAINATTVEVAFKEEVKDINSLKFSVDGLDVKNAAVKQSNSKVVVLTTASQEGDKEYTLKLNGESLGKFKGISAVTPEKINIETSSLQGIVGKEVTVKAKVEVKEGQSKAGIPVTFNIKTDNTKFNEDHVEEVYTDENGVAQYSYTQYAGGDDQVIAYATGDANKRATNGKVYWGVNERLTITPVNDTTSLSNGAKKVYKVKATTPTGGKASGYVNVAFAENNNVTPDKAVTTVEVTDASNYGTKADKYPYQYTTGGTDYVRVKLDKDGEATFTLSGKDASVTPIVFIDGSFNSTNEIEANWTGDNKWSSTELQAKAPTVKFEAVQSFDLALESKGVSEASSITGKGNGGRDYKAVITNKDGKLAPKGTKVYVVFKEENLKKNYISGDVKVFDLDKEVRTNVSVPGSNGLSNVITLETNSKGEVEFTVEGYENNFAVPTVYLETGDKSGLDKNDLQKDGAIVYFGEAIVKNATLKVTNTDGDEVKAVTANEQATFTYQSVDQNEKAYYDKDFYTTFEVTAGFNDVVVHGHGTVKAGTTESYKVNASQGKAEIKVSAADVTDVKVHASASQNSLPNLDASVSVSKYATGNLVTGTVSGWVNSTDTFYVEDAKGKLHYFSYASSTYKENGSLISKVEFEDLLAKPTVKLSVTKDEDGKLTFNVLQTGIVIADTKAPTLLSADVTNTNQVTLTFDEAVTVSGLATEFAIGGNASTAVAVSGSDNKKVVITFTSALTGGAQTITYTAAGGDDVIKDASNNQWTIPATINATSTLGVVLAATTEATAGVNPIAEVSSTLFTGATGNSGAFAVTFADGVMTQAVAVATIVAGDDANTVASKIAAALNADTTVNAEYTATTNNAAVILTQNAGSEASATPSLTVSTAGTAGVTVTTATAKVTTGSAGTPEVADTAITTPNLTGAAVTKAVTVTDSATGLNRTVNVTFLSTDTTAALVAQRIADVLNGDALVSAVFTASQNAGKLRLTKNDAGITTVNVTVN